MQRDHGRLAYLSLYAFIAMACACGSPGGCSGIDLSGCGAGLDCSLQDNDEDGFTACDDDSGWNYGRDSGSTGGDCNDYDPSVYPGADEWCDGKDDDCNGTIDDNALDYDVVWVDADKDGFGAGAEHFTCNNPGGYSTNNDDCDDHDASSSPDKDEVCDDADNDCDGEIDEEVGDPPTWYADNDRDGRGDPATMIAQCDGLEGYVATGDDCDDDNAAVAPDVAEVCGTEVDEDCSAATPDNCSYAIGDLDGSTLGGAYGAREGDRAAAALANAGDLDRDGYDDVLVGNPGSGATPAGVYLLHGPVNGWTSLSDAAGHLETGESADLAGTSVAGAGDVNGDGHPDVLFGAPGSTADGVTPGSAWLLYGPDLADCSPFCEGALLVGPGDDALAGYAATGVEDSDGDGLDDIVVGAPRATGGGSVALLLDAPAGSIAWNDAFAFWRSDGAGVAGAIVLAAGDVDGDGYADFGVVDTEGARIWVVTERPAGASWLDDAAVQIHIPTDDGNLASVVLDDLDGDSAIDVLGSFVRDQATAADVIARGAAGPLAGVIEAGDISISTDYVYANAGGRVASLGDVDFDGSADLVFMALAASALLPPEYTVQVDTEPTLWARSGPLSGAASLGTGTTRILLDADAYPFAGGDVNGDLRPDLLLGNPLDTTAGTDAGALRVVSGDAVF